MEPTCNARNVRVKLLKAAREDIRIGRYTFICQSLGWHRTPWNTWHVDYLQEWVGQMIKPSATYGGWLMLNHRDLATGLTPEQFIEKAREGRLAWIDWMIQEVQK